MNFLGIFAFFLSLWKQGAVAFCTHPCAQKKNHADQQVVLVGLQMQDPNLKYKPPLGCQKQKTPCALPHSRGSLRKCRISRNEHGYIIKPNMPGIKPDTMLYNTMNELKRAAHEMLLEEGLVEPLSHSKSGMSEADAQVLMQNPRAHSKWTPVTERDLLNCGQSAASSKRANTTQQQLLARPGLQRQQEVMEKVALASAEMQSIHSKIKRELCSVPAFHITTDVRRMVSDAQVVKLGHLRIEDYHRAMAKGVLSNPQQPTWADADKLVAAACSSYGIELTDSSTLHHLLKTLPTPRRMGPHPPEVS